MQVLLHYTNAYNRELLHVSAPTACRRSFNKKYATENALCEVGMRNCLRRLHAKCQQQQHEHHIYTHCRQQCQWAECSAGGAASHREQRDLFAIPLLCLFFECRLTGLHHELRKYAARNVIHQLWANMCGRCRLQLKTYGYTLAQCQLFWIKNLHNLLLFLCGYMVSFMLQQKCVNVCFAPATQTWSQLKLCNYSYKAFKIRHI